MCSIKILVKSNTNTDRCLLFAYFKMRFVTFGTLCDSVRHSLWCSLLLAWIDVYLLIDILFLLVPYERLILIAVH